MKFVDILIIAAIALLLFFALRYIIKHRGRCPGCGGDCSCCAEKCDKNKNGENKK